MTMPKLNQPADISANSRHCSVISVEKSDSPGGAPGADWYRYVISSPGTEITGYRRGKKRDVLDYLDKCTTQLNERLNAAKPRKAAGRTAATQA